MQEMIVIVDGKIVQRVLCTSKQHYASNLEKYFYQKCPFHRNGSRISSVQEDINGSATFTYSK